MKRHIAAQLALAATTLATQQAWALGFGRVATDSVLGHPLRFAAPVHADAGEHFGSECVTAAVYFGETQLRRNEVRTTVEAGAAEGDWVVRVRTLVPIREPIVEISLNVDCGRIFVRRYTAFADPPGLGAADAPDASEQPLTLPAGEGGAGPASALAASAVDSPPGATPPAAADRDAANAGRRHHKGPTLQLALDEAQHPRAAHRASARRHPHHDDADAAPLKLVLDGGTARLKLDLQDPPVWVAAGAGARASGPVPAAQAEFEDPAMRQLHELEKSIEAMKRDSLSNRQQTERLRVELQNAQSRGDLLPWLIGLLLLAVGAAGALAYRLRQQSVQSRPAADWLHTPAEVAGPAPATAPQPLPEPPEAEMPRASRPPEEALLLEPVEPDGGAVADLSSTQPLDRAALADVVGAGGRDVTQEVSVEELLDLEQQADFFIALGQEDAAVDLLMSRLRSAGGQSPLPYTKLLEIYRRQGDRSAYERVRARFNRRFNAYAPDWDTGPGAGRLLEHYPDTIGQIQAVWSSPIDAMATLEALLFRRDDASELFDLPAYRDVLLLYSVARDLWQLGGGPLDAPVDVLLPLDDAGALELRPASAVAPALSARGPAPAHVEITGFDPRRDIDAQVPLVDPDAPDALDDVHLVPPTPAAAPVPEAPSWDTSGPGSEPPAAWRR